MQTRNLSLPKLSINRKLTMLVHTDLLKEAHNKYAILVNIFHDITKYKSRFSNESTKMKSHVKKALGHNKFL